LIDRILGREEGAAPGSKMKKRSREENSDDRPKKKRKKNKSKDSSSSGEKTGKVKTTPGWTASTCFVCFYQFGDSTYMKRKFHDVFLCKNCNKMKGKAYLSLKNSYEIFEIPRPEIRKLFYGTDRKGKSKKGDRKFEICWDVLEKEALAKFTTLSTAMNKRRTRLEKKKKNSKLS